MRETINLIRMIQEAEGQGWRIIVEGDALGDWIAIQNKELGITGGPFASIGELIAYRRGVEAALKSEASK